MQRHRKVAAAPQRNSSECWQTIVGLIRESLERSQHISTGEIDSTLRAAEGVGRQLVAGGHLDRDKSPVTVVAADLHLSINTVSGDKALALEENLNYVPGAAKAREWMIYLPTPAPLGSVVENIVATDAHLSSADPPAPRSESKAASSVVDEAALTEWAGRKS